MDKSSLEALLSRYNWLMGISTISVAVGILGEYVAHFLFEKGERRKLEIGVSVAFGVLVLGGVSGEYIFGSKLSNASEELQRMADNEVARLNKEAGQAREAASGAMERIASGETQVAQAQEATAKASAQAAAANERARKLEVEAAEQRERAAKAEHDLLEIQERMAPRRITAAQEVRLLNDLKPLAGKHVAVFVLAGQPENEAFGYALSSALQKASLEVEIQPGTMLGGGPVQPGISLIVGKNRLADANILAKALADADLAAKPISAQRSDTDDELLQILIAPR
jgi:hypothetical protein